jgi:NTE family protein
MSFVSRLKRILGRERRLGLVLGSGGARGLAHIGVLKVLEEAGIPLHCVVGSSAGALVGGLYCAGTSPAKLAGLFGNLSRKDVARILLPTMGQGGIVDGRRVKRFIEPYAGGKSIEDLSPSFACVATDLFSGKRVVFDRGDLMESIRASISIPGIFTPVICGDRVLVDGGVVDPLPIRLAFEMGATCAIVVRVGRRFSFERQVAKRECVFQDDDTELKPGDRVEEVEEVENVENVDWLRSSFRRIVASHRMARDEASITPPIVEIILSTLAIYDYRLSELSIKSAGDHILVEPSLPEIEILDFHKGSQAIAAGEEAMRARIAELERFRKR